MGIRFPSAVTPDFNNYSFFGKAWEDRANGVTELSAQIGSGGKALQNNAVRHAHQHKLLAARLNTFLDTAATPVLATRTAIGNNDAPYLNAPLISLRDARVLPSFSNARHASTKSFNESKAASKLAGDYLRCDEPVRKGFLEKLETEISQLQGNRKLRARLRQLHADLSRLSEKKVQDLDALADRKSQLEARKDKAASMSGRDKVLAQTKLVLKSTNRELRSIERKTHEILHPSSYELHRIDNNGEKVTDRPLHVEEMKLRSRGKSSGAIGGLRSEIDVRDFTAMQFDALADAMRSFHQCLAAGDGASAADEQALRNAAKPILYSGDREAVHRFIRDMTRQLKRAGVAPAELNELNALIPDRPGASWKMMQAMVPGTGKQMRLQDEAERMAKALPKLLTLTAAHAEQLRNNLMQFDVSGVNAFFDYMGGESAQVSNAFSFIRSPQGKKFVDAIAQKGEFILGPQHHFVTKLRASDCRNNPYITLYRAEQLLDVLSWQKKGIFQITDSEIEIAASEIKESLIQENKHLFMLTSDPDFWEREAVDKIGTPLMENEDFDARNKSRIFKQMKMRAAAMGMDKKDVDAFMIQGITNTLRNRNMAIVGTKIGGVIGSVAGNISSTPLSAAVAPHAPVLAVPGILDSVLMPVGWGTGLGPGALFGATVLNRMKRDRLEEGNNNREVVQIHFDGNAGLRSAGHRDTAAGKTIGVGGKWLVKRKAVQKPALSPSLQTGLGQFGHAHAQVWKGMAGDISSMLWKPVRYVLYTGPKDAWKDLVIHNDPKLAERTRTAYSPAFTPVVIEQATTASM